MSKWQCFNLSLILSVKLQYTKTRQMHTRMETHTHVCKYMHHSQ